MEPGVSFGSYRFDADSGRLWAGTREVRITPKAADVLKLLVSRAGEPVSKDEIFASVWTGIAVSDDALTTCIRELRKALDDDAKEPRYIETRHRRGYRFVAPLTAVANPSGAAAAPALISTPDATAIAVLPFTDMSPERDQEYLCYGLAEELINALTRIDGLQVASRTASFQFNTSGADVAEVGRLLRVATLLEGSVRKADDRLRITVQLIDVATGYHLWSERFDRKLADVFAIQDEIAQHVASSLRVSVMKEREKPVRPRTTADAYEYFLRAKSVIPRMTAQDLEHAVETFEKAIALDPGYSPAYACMSVALGTLYEWFGANEEDLSKADAASRKAMELSPELAESHLARGVTLSLLKQHKEASKAFEKSIRLNPNLFESYYYYARDRFARGDIEGSAELFGKAAAARRDDFQSPMLQAQSLTMLGRHKEALAAAREGIRRAEQMLVLNPLDQRALSLGCGALFLDGQVARAKAWADKAMELYPDDMGALVNRACLHLKMKEKEPALALLERVFEKGWAKRDWLEHDPDYDIIREDPRFKRMMATLK
jgi:adenylate cyclase